MSISWLVGGERYLLRAATADDAPAIAGVQVRAWRAGYRGIVSDAVLAEPSVDERARQWREWLAAGADVLVASASSAVPCGFCAARRPSGEPPQIAALYVDPASWRSGIGTMLLAAAFARLRAAGHAEVTLWVFEANARARAFYARFGFADDGGRDLEHDGAPEIRLRASLTSCASDGFRGPDQEF